MTLRGPRELVVVGAGAILAALIFWALALAKMGAFELVVRGTTMRVRRTFFGVPLTTRTIDVDRVTGVTVERGALSPLPRVRGESLLEAGRLVLVFDGPMPVPLSTSLFPGRAVHLHAAASLRSALLLAPHMNDDAELEALPMRTMPLGRRLFYAWPGMVVGELVGTSLTAVGLPVHARVDASTVAFGALVGAAAGLAAVLYATRARPPS